MTFYRSLLYIFSIFFLAVNFTLAIIVFPQHIVAKCCGGFQCFYSIFKNCLFWEMVFSFSTEFSAFQLPTFDHSIIFNIPLTAKLTCEVILLTRKFRLISFGRKPVRHFTRFREILLATPNNDISGLRIRFV